MISIPSSQLLGKLRNGHLTKLLVAIGARSTGNKNVLIGELVGECGREKLMKSGTGVASTTARSKGTTRVLSIDMGIKNLAFCVCDVPVLSAPGKRMSSEESEATQENGQIESTLELSVVAWKRIAVAGSTTPIGRKKKKKKKKKGSPENVDVEEKSETSKAYVERDDPFSPMQLSKTAFKLVREVLLPYNPDTILIERQRFRSGGGSAVQEWTVRVNMFESMIWAILTTLKNEGITAPTKSKTDSKREEEKISRPQIWDVSPMRVATFWIGKEAKKVAERAKLDNHDVKKGRTKVEKKEKVDLVQRWILSDAEGIEINEAVNITFEDGAARTRDAFMASKSGPNRKSAALRKIKEPKVMKGPKTVTVPVVELPEVPGTPTKESLQEEPLLDIGKLDDLADCLLQAGAWTKWEMNRLAVKGMVEEGDIEGLEEWVSDNE